MYGKEYQDGNYVQLNEKWLRISNRGGNKILRALEFKNIHTHNEWAKRYMKTDFLQMSVEQP